MDLTKELNAKLVPCNCILIVFVVYVKSSSGIIDDVRW